MANVTVDGVTLGYELIGASGQPWVITPGGRFTKESPGVRELAEALVAGGKRVLIWDRPNCGESSVRFEGPTESDMQADALAALLHHLDLAPAVIMGGSGGARVSLLTAANHPDVAAGLAVLWISGGVFGLMSLGVHYCGPSIQTAWADEMAAVAGLPEWAEVTERNPANRQRFLDQDRHDVHWDHGAVDARLLPPGGRARPRAARRPRPGRSGYRHWCSAAERATPFTPGRRPRRWPG